MPRKQLLHILIGAGITLALVLPLAIIAYVKSGMYNVGASSPHSKLTEWLTHETMIHSVRRHAGGIQAPVRFTPAQVARGACAYEAHCVACHGASAVARQQWVSGMEPAPPYLVDVTRRFSSRELFWIAKNGIKMTGMPAWRNSMSDDQLWDVVAFLEAKTDSQTYRRWRSAGACRRVSGAPSPGPLSTPRP